MSTDTNLPPSPPLPLPPPPPPSSASLRYQEGHLDGGARPEDPDGGSSSPLPPKKRGRPFGSVGVRKRKEAVTAAATAAAATRAREEFKERRSLRMRTLTGAVTRGGGAKPSLPEVLPVRGTAAWTAEEIRVAVHSVGHLITTPFAFTHLQRTTKGGPEAAPSPEAAPGSKVAPAEAAPRPNRACLQRQVRRCSVMMRPFFFFFTLFLTNLDNAYRYTVEVVSERAKGFWCPGFGRVRDIVRYWYEIINTDFLVLLL